MPDQLVPPPTIPVPHSEMFRPSGPAPSSSDIMSALKSAPAPGSRSPMGDAPKPRGRPRGSTNRKPPTPEEELKAKAERIKADAEEMATWIADELNDHIMAMLLNVKGITPGMLYKAGHVPPTMANDSKFTELGNMFAIPPSLARSASRLVAEAKATDQGSKLSGQVGLGKAGIIIAAIGTLFGTVQYAKGVNTVLQNVQQLQGVIGQAQESDAGQSSNGSATSEAMKAGLVG